MKTQTNQIIEKRLTMILARMNRSKVVQWLNGQSEGLNGIGTETKESCTACNTYQNKEKK